MNQRVKTLLAQSFSHLDRRLHKKCRSRRVSDHVPDNIVDAFGLAKLRTSHENHLLNGGVG
jgi:hypothetical protein